MRTLYPKRTYPIGIDIGCDALRMVQLRDEGEGRLAVEAAARREILLPAQAGPEVRRRAIANALTDALAMTDFRGRLATISLPSDLVHIRTIRMGSLPQVGRAIPPELAAMFDINLANATLRLIHAGTVRHSPPEGEEMIALAVGDEELGEFTQCIHDTGIRPASMEVRLLALERCAGRIIGDSPTRALLEVDGDIARMLICRGESVCFLKDIPSNAGEIIRTLARALSISRSEARELRRRTMSNINEPVCDDNDSVVRAVADAGRTQLETLACEVARCLRYHAVTFRGPSPDALILAGQAADDSQLSRLLAEQSGLTVRVLNPLVGIDTTQMRAIDRGEHPAQWSVAVGLALHDAKVQRMKMPAQYAQANSGQPADPSSSSPEVAVA